MTPVCYWFLAMAVVNLIGSFMGAFIGALGSPSCLHLCGSVTCVSLDTGDYTLSSLLPVVCCWGFLAGLRNLDSDSDNVDLAVLSGYLGRKTLSALEILF